MQRGNKSTSNLSNEQRSREKSTASIIWNEKREYAWANTHTHAHVACSMCKQTQRMCTNKPFNDCCNSKREEQKAQRPLTTFQMNEQIGEKLSWQTKWNKFSTKIGNKYNSNEIVVFVACEIVCVCVVYCFGVLVFDHFCSKLNNPIGRPGKQEQYTYSTHTKCVCFTKLNVGRFLFCLSAFT